jgi:hypothetical protein
MEGPKDGLDPFSSVGSIFSGSCLVADWLFILLLGDARLLDVTPSSLGLPRDMSSISTYLLKHSMPAVFPALFLIALG